MEIASLLPFSPQMPTPTMDSEQTSMGGGDRLGIVVAGFSLGTPLPRMPSRPSTSISANIFTASALDLEFWV
jgi:hypothetical protein